MARRVELELSLVDVEVLSVQQPQNVPETNVVSLALSESSWHVVDSFSFISSRSMTHLRRLQFTFVSRHDIAWWFDEVCDLVQTPHYSLLELALEFRSLSPGVQLRKLDYIANAVKTGVNEKYRLQQNRDSQHNHPDSVLVCRHRLGTVRCSSGVCYV
jgi:hypothetical protein